MFKKYELVEQENNIAIKLKRGKYRGIIFSYGKIALSDPNNDGGLRLLFDHYIHKNPNDIKFDQEFVDYIGDIIVEIMADHQNINVESGENLVVISKK